MAGRTPGLAYQQHREPIADALRCISQQRLSVPHGRAFQVGQTYTMMLNGGDPVALRSLPTIHFSAGQQFRIAQAEDADQWGPFHVHTVEYWYQLATPIDEILAFHWTPEDDRPGMRRFPHFHVGKALLKDPTPVLPGNFDRVHVPSGGRVSIEAVIRFAIEELGVRPLQSNWEAVLTRTELGFLKGRTRTE